MKKTTLSLLTIAALLTSCDLNVGNKPTNGSTDSTSVAATEVNDGFTSSDARLHDVRGNVKKLFVRSAECDESRTYDEQHGDWVSQDWVFDEKGNAKRTDLAVEIKETRNDKGQLVKTVADIPETAASVIEEYLYNSQGMVETQIINGLEWTGKKTYKYDASLNLVSVSESSASEGRFTEEVTTFDVKERDNQGNWTKRYTTTTIKSGPDNGSGKFDEEDVIYGVDLRTITYK